MTVRARRERRGQHSQERHCMKCILLDSALAIGLAIACFLVPTRAAEAPDPVRDKEMRDRYETVLLRNPFQERAFNSVYEGYAKMEGVDKWVEALKPKADAGEQTVLLLLGQIYDRQFKTADAITALEKASAKGEARPQFKVLLGTLYYKAGKDDKATRYVAWRASATSPACIKQDGPPCSDCGAITIRSAAARDRLEI